MFANLANLFRYRGLIQSLVARELKARYRGSVLGFFWSFVNPLLMLGIYSFVFGTIMKSDPKQMTNPYSIFICICWAAAASGGHPGRQGMNPVRNALE